MNKSITELDGAQIRRLKRRVKMLREALKPFAYFHEMAPESGVLQNHIDRAFNVYHTTPDEDND